MFQRSISELALDLEPFQWEKECWCFVQKLSSRTPAMNQLHYGESQNEQKSRWKQRILNKYQNSNPLKFPLQVAPFVHPLQFVHHRIMIYRTKAWIHNTCKWKDNGYPRDISIDRQMVMLVKVFANCKVKECRVCSLHTILKSHSFDRRNYLPS